MLLYLSHINSSRGARRALSKAPCTPTSPALSSSYSHPFHLNTLSFFHTLFSLSFNNPTNLTKKKTNTFSYTYSHITNLSNPYYTFISLSLSFFITLMSSSCQHQYLQSHTNLPPPSQPLASASAMALPSPSASSSSSPPSCSPRTPASGSSHPAPGIEAASLSTMTTSMALMPPTVETQDGPGPL